LNPEGVTASSEARLKRGAYLALLRLRLRAGLVYPLLCLLLGHWAPVMFGIGVVLVLLGMLLRLFSAGVIRKDDELGRSGPYALCRNPLYLGTLGILLGFGLISGSWLIAIVGFLFFFWLYHLVITHEERWLLSHFGGEYLEYMRAVPRLAPKLAGWAQMVVKPGFSLEQLRVNRELGSTVAAVVGVLLFLLKYALGWNLPFNLW